MAFHALFGNNCIRIFDKVKAQIRLISEMKIEMKVEGPTHCQCTYLIKCGFSIRNEVTFPTSTK